MRFEIIHQHYVKFIELAHHTGWPNARRPQPWARGIGADLHFVEALSNNQEGRDYLKKLCAETSVPPEVCFLAIMAWGGMKSDHGRLAWQLRDKWTPIISDLRKGQIERKEAYSRFRAFRNENPRCGFGPAYFTKLIFFTSPRHDGYIMDQWTSISLNKLVTFSSRPIVSLIRGQTRGRLSYSVSDTNGSDGYEIFCQGIEFLANQKDIIETFKSTHPEDIEMRMFSFGGRNPAAWRNYIKENLAAD